MDSNILAACIKVAACVCGKDGVISEIEEQTIFQIVQSKYPKFGRASFEEVIVDFFDSDEQVDDLLVKIVDEAHRKFTLELAEQSASSDGLELRENIALQRIYLLWGIESNA